MLTASYLLDDGLVLSLADLRRVLADLSRESGRWWLDNPRTLDQAVPLGTVWSIQVHSSQAGPNQVTNEVSFSVPVVAAISGEDEEHIAVCLHPELIEPQIEGLYLEQRKIKSDFMRWTPWLRQPNKTLFAVRCNFLDRQDHCGAF